MATDLKYLDNITLTSDFKRDIIKTTNCKLTREQWEKNNPIPAEGQICIEGADEDCIGLDHSMVKIKLGDGQRHWADLPYIKNEEVMNKVDEVNKKTAQLQVCVNDEIVPKFNENIDRINQVIRSKEKKFMKIILTMIGIFAAIEIATICFMYNYVDHVDTQMNTMETTISELKEN